MKKSSAKTQVKDSQRKRRVVIGVVLALVVAAGLVGVVFMGSDSSKQANSPVAANKATSPATAPVARKVDYEVVATYPHDRKAFLQGLLWHDGSLYESTGQYGQSKLRKLELPSGNVVKSIDLPPDVFGEGLALADNRLIQLTWTSGRGFVYDLETFRLLREFTYRTEGWGLTYDGKELILSDGSSYLTYMDAESFLPTRRLQVKMNGRPLEEINELEFIEGEIWANVWHSDKIMRIDPATGNVTSYLDMAGLLKPEQRPDPEAVLNGIAYDSQNRRIFVSGKLWPLIFEITVK